MVCVTAMKIQGVNTSLSMYSTLYTLDINDVADSREQNYET